MCCGNRWSIVLAAWVFCSSPDFADFQDGNTLLQDCTQQDLLFCVGYIDGIADALRKNWVDGFRACLSENVTAGQLKDIVVQYLLLNPAVRHTAAVGLVSYAISKAFPWVANDPRPPPFATSWRLLQPLYIGPAIPRPPMLG
jgi:hypothetical protein